jgi:protein SCO1/2
MSTSRASLLLLMTAAVAASALLALPPPAFATLTADQLATVTAAPPVGARLPLSATLPDATGAWRTLAGALGGRPTVLVFADYSCRSLCGPILAIAAAGLAKTGLVAGRDFRLLVVGLDPKDGAAEARRMRRAQIGSGPLADASTFLLAEEAPVRRIADAVGYHYAYDSDLDQYAHPAVVYVLTGDGRVSRTLTALGLGPADLRLALVEAGEGRLGTFADHLRLLCYGFDSATGVYTPLVRTWLAVATALTILVVGGGIGFMLIGRRPATAAYPPPTAPTEPA